MIDEEMAFVPKIPDWFDVRKAAHVAAFFAKLEGGRINVLKLAKLIYLADRASMEEREFPITRDDLKAMKFGPMNSNTYDCANGAPVAGLEPWHEVIAPREGNEIALAKPIEMDDLDELSRADRRILQATWDRFKNVDQWVLANWTHRYCPEWTDPGNSSHEIPYAEVFRMLGKADPDGLARQLMEDRRVAASLSH